MHLSPREIEKLMLHNAGFLAQKRLARGLRLNHPETVALIATQILELIRDGKSVAELMDLGRQMLGIKNVMPGVGDMIYDVQVEGTFPDGTKLVTVHHPISAEYGNLELALHGSFLPIPDASHFSGDVETLLPGEMKIEPGEIELNAGRTSIQISVTNMGDRPVQVGSHYHFIETNAALVFDRELAYGHRLDIPAGTAVRFEPGSMRTVKLIPIAGAQVIQGGNAIASGKISDAGKKQAMEKVAMLKFGHQAERP